MIAYDVILYEVIAYDVFPYDVFPYDVFTSLCMMSLHVQLSVVSKLCGVQKLLCT